MTKCSVVIPYYQREAGILRRALASVFAQSHADFRAMRKHFRTFFIVSGVNGKPAFFRYYDPRVLRVYLPSCTPDELDTVFGPIIHYLVESETGDAVLRFHAANGALIRESLALANA